MNNFEKKRQNDEIDVSEFFPKLWQGKAYILFFSILFVFLGSFYLHSVDREYTVEYKLKPVGKSSNAKTSISGINGIASMAGIELPSASSGDFVIFEELISSIEVSEILFKNESMIKDIFSSEWNESLNDFIAPPKSEFRILLSDFKNLLTGNENSIYMPPNPRRLSIFISENIALTINKKSGFLSLSSETSMPDLMLTLMIEAALVTDRIMRQRYVEFSAQPLAFYKEKLQTARSREHRESLAELIIEEEQKLMLASRAGRFVAEPYILPTISLQPTTPKPKLILGLALFFGVFVGINAVFISNLKIKDD